jgi:lipoyl(octanoyl) transferase
MLMELASIDLGRMDYDEAYSCQQSYRELRICGGVGDTLLFVEHPPVITLGRRADQRDILIPRDRAAELGVKIVSTDRGGEVTYHGPGQLVGYLIIHLSVTGGSVRRFVERIEEAIILLASGYGIDAERKSEHRGVWVGEEKLAALGLSVSRQVTMHGFALNVNTDLDHFSWIIPCGIRGKGITSLERLLGRKVAMDEVKARLEARIAEVFGYDSLARKPFRRGEADE